MKIGVALLAVMTMFQGCNSGNDPNKPAPNINGDQNVLWNYAIKQGTVEYDIQYYNTEPNMGEDIKLVLIFDEYGKKLRVEHKQYDPYGTIFTERIYIKNDVDKKYYVLFPPDMTYAETSLVDQVVNYFYYDYNGTRWWDNGSGDSFKKLPNRTIAGKDCNVCSVSDGDSSNEYAGWNRILFYKKSGISASSDWFDEIITATDFLETIPPDSFTLPGGYTKMN